MLVLFVMSASYHRLKINFYDHKELTLPFKEQNKGSNEHNLLT